MRALIGLVLMASAGAVFAFTAQWPGTDRQSFETSAGPVHVERMAGPFDAGWGFAFLGEDGILVTEKDGRLWHVAADGSRAEVSGLPPIEAVGQGGLMDVVAARDFAETRAVFLTYAAPVGNATRTTLAEARLSDGADRLEGLRVIFAQDPPVRSSRHFGSRIVERADGTLFVTIGDRGEPANSQKRDRTIGKVLRVARDGTVPADNPFAGDPDTRAEIWSLGHRNPQGAALDAEGRLWTVSHGARGGDEINRPEPGLNYGWPRISYGTHYSGAPFAGTEADGLEQPLHYWDPSIAPSGMMIYSGRLFPEWQGDIFVGALRAGLVSRLDMRPGPRIGTEERFFQGVYGRVRDIREAPDGTIWFLTDAREGALYRISPAE